MRALAIVVLLVMLAGCGAPHYVYERRNATPAQIDRDLEACRRDGFRPHRFAIWPSNRYDWDAVNLCMERKGYAVRQGDD